MGHNVPSMVSVLNLIQECLSMVLLSVLKLIRAGRVVCPICELPITILPIAKSFFLSSF